jgi:hypothetical protein
MCSIHRKKQRKIKKIRDSITFYCPICQKRIKFPYKSKWFQKYVSNEINSNQAIAFLKRMHWRHEHTDYDTILRELLDEYKDVPYGGYTAKKIARSRIIPQIREIRHKYKTYKIKKFGVKND